MSTEQTGVNAPTTEEPTQDEHAPRGSRRAIRQAERAAEREAILTGQQPLLTRREMRRLREEAKALRAAVEAGEITPEQAQALQDPLADPASVTSRSSAPSGDDAGTGLEESVEFPAVGEGEFYLEQEGQNPPLNLSVPEGPSASAPSWRSLSAAEAVAISEIETGLMEAVDLPVATLDYDAHWAQDTSSEPAPVPTRFSLKERLEGGPASDAEERGDQDGAALQAPGEDTGGTEAEELAAGPYDYREDFSPSAQSDEAPSSAASAASSQPSSQSAEAVSAVPAVSTSASGAADFATFGQAGAPQAAESARSGLSAGSASSAGSVRRPIVRIPAAAQGVRTVNVSTGELSSVQPVDSSPSAQEAADAQDVYGVASIEEPMTQETVTVDVEAQAAMPTPSEQPEVEFGTPGAPQWKSLHQPSQVDSFQETIVSGVADATDPAVAMSGEAVGPYAFYADEVETGNGPVGGSEWDSVAVPAAEAPEEPYLAPVNEVTGRVPTPDHVLPVEQANSSSRIGKVLMALLIVVVLLLIIAVVAWLLIANGSNSASAMSAVGAGEWIRQVV
ncbi:hypothetical protein [Actinomyces naeslundii]|uniref:Uncharacterized protein n=2 Tax=Actinomyces naeslundii TaxID=1655 RepID=J3JKJ0_ACTNH|nr:hypothetical protein [Actinomyces naeslundii]EJN85376.1 hypothetical protein HMPREF1129_0961 [Actinomyces naeslundii str. Howell 279]OMG37572.1 hypothetical protein BKH33_03685 [Actinomyces naeslundii]QQC20422.1 hypothetical protein I6H94_10855 [Actinomyces naeslundii]